MSSSSKRYRAAAQLIDASKKYPLAEALKVIKSLPGAKFDQTVDIAIRLGIDPKKSDENVRGTVSLPAGTGKKVRVLVFAKGEKEAEARAAGADVVGGDELIDRIANEGFLDFDKAVATPDMMRNVGKIARVLGPRGLMPNPKTNTVTLEIAQAVRDLKGGMVSFKVDKAGILHTIIGKTSFTEEQLLGNAMALLDVVQRAKPSTSKGVYMRGIALSATMSPAVRVDPAAVEAALREAHPA